MEFHPTPIVFQHTWTWPITNAVGLVVLTINSSQLNRDVEISSGTEHPFGAQGQHIRSVASKIISAKRWGCQGNANKYSNTHWLQFATLALAQRVKTEMNIFMKQRFSCFDCLVWYIASHKIPLSIFNARSASRSEFSARNVPSSSASSPSKLRNYDIVYRRWYVASKLHSTSRLFCGWHVERIATNYYKNRTEDWISPLFTSHFIAMNCACVGWWSRTTFGWYITL